MVVVSYSGKEINAKLVYYGPGLSGKTTNLEYIYQSVPSGNRGKMVSMKTRTERTLFFDFLPIDLGDIGGFKTRFLLYTVPGQVYYNATRKLVLRGVDAVIFVADSGRGKMEENIESLQNLRENLREYGLSLEEIPWVLQYNKRDLPDAYTVEELEEALNPGGIPYYEAVATTGQGVFECFRGIARLLLQKLGKEIKLGPAPARGASPGGASVRPSALVAGDAAPAAAAAPPPLPPAARPAPTRPQAPPPDRPYRPVPPAGTDRAKAGGRPTFPFPAPAAPTAPAGAPRPLARTPGAGGNAAAPNAESGISQDPFATGDGGAPRATPAAPRPPARVSPIAAAQPPAFLAPRKTEGEAPLSFDAGDELEGIETPLELGVSLSAPDHEEPVEPPMAPGTAVESSLDREFAPPSPSRENPDDERLRRAAELAERLREAEAREAEREARKEGGLLGRLFRRRSRDREAPPVESTPFSAAGEGEVEEFEPARAPDPLPPFEEAAADIDAFAPDEEPAAPAAEAEPEPLVAAPSFAPPPPPLPPVVIERRVRVPVTVSGEDIRRGVKLQLTLDIDVREQGDADVEEDDAETRESRVA